MNSVLIRKDKPFKLTEQEARKVADAITELGEKVSGHHRLSVCKHEADNRILECAAQGNADYIITGDSHLLEMKSFGGIQIVTVADFLAKLMSDSP
jgi:putative PIN family toxin of toxin-antitoxin system